MPFIICRIIDSLKLEITACQIIHVGRPPYKYRCCYSQFSTAYANPAIKPSGLTYVVEFLLPAMPFIICRIIDSLKLEITACQIIHVGRPPYKYRCCYSQFSTAYANPAIKPSGLTYVVEFLLPTAQESVNHFYQASLKSGLLILVRL